MKKCQVLCANCHRIYHYDENEVKKLAKRKK
jgi:predicted HNH restriction endonuclease